MSQTVIFGGAVAAGAVYLVVIYNRLVAGRNNYKNAYSQIDVQMRRRYDLIPNLVETTKAYLAHEKGLFEAIAAARANAMRVAGNAAVSPGDPAAMARVDQAEGGLTSALGKLFAVAEAYPELKSIQSVTDLMEELATTENRIAFARQAYNDAATGYNTAIEVFPASIIANMTGFNQVTLLESATAEQREAIKVSLS